MKAPKQKFKNWTEIDWDGNLSLGYKCYRKSFGRGHVSVGIGEFKLIVYSHGPNSDDSMSSTRSRLARNQPDQTEQEAMDEVDSNGGYWK